mgnify:CR=1 FL=1
MAWNGTVYCGFCGGKGHNRRSCEKLKAHQQERYEEAMKTPVDERSYYDEVAINRWNARHEKKSVSRTCTYCGKTGHNRRSCEHLKAHMAHVHEQNVAFKKAFLEWTHASGLGVGALVRQKKRKCLMYVTGLKWETVNVWCASDHIPAWICASDLSRMGQNMGNNMLSQRHPDGWPTGPKWGARDSRWIEDRYDCEVVSGVPSKVEPPKDWLEFDPKEMKEFFSERELWQAESESRVWSLDFWNLDEKKQSLKESA